MEISTQQVLPKLLSFIYAVTLFFFFSFVKNRILGLSLVIDLSNNKKKEIKK